jgi:hypothetical protein
VSDRGNEREPSLGALESGQRWFEHHVENLSRCLLANPPPFQSAVVSCLRALNTSHLGKFENGDCTGIAADLDQGAVGDPFGRIGR